MPERPWGLVVGLLFAAGSVVGQEAAARRIAVTDPAELAAIGMPRDARHVYRWTGADARRARRAPAAPSTQTWGTATGFTTASSLDLVPEHHSGLMQGTERAYCPLGYGGGAFAQEALIQLQLPEGAALGYLEVWGNDEDPTYGLTVRVFEFCQAVGFDPPTTTLIGSIDSVGSAGPTYDATPLNGYPVNNRDCGYSARVIFIPGNVSCHSDQIQFRKLAVLWDRRVSPAPASATFGDVPPGHAFFPFIEALAKSGITGGCGGGNFCPDSPLTRGQMAVFLAKGLGMGWQ